MTKSSATVGSPLYMSPEMINGARQADARCDIWALGVILYELLSGVTPFMGENLYGVLLAIAQRTPASVRSHAPHVPPRLDAVLMKCLEKDPARRYQDVAQLAAALVEFGPPRSQVSLERIHGVLGGMAGATSDLPRPASAVVAPVTRLEMGSGSTASSWGQTSPSRQTDPFKWLGVGGAVMMGLIGVGWYMSRARPVLDGNLKDSASHEPARSAAAELPTVPASLPVADSAAARTDAALSPSATSAAAPAPSTSVAPPAAATSHPLPVAKGGPRRPFGAAPAKTSGLYDDRK